MGGALARTGKKWKEVQKEVATPKYVVCNGDESEPGTFKDRELLLHTPDLVVEGLLLAGLFLQAERGYFYIRHEYHEQIEAVRRSILRARQAVPEAFRSFDLEVFVSPGGYICGEQSALLEAIEARRAQPRNEPPKIATNGLFDKPTLVNNVETLAWIPGIVVHGVDWYKKEKLRFFSVSGDVEKPGVYEVSTEQTLGHLIMTRAGGIRGNRALRAIASSGPSGGFLLPVLEALALRQIIEKKLPGSADGRRRRRPTWRNSRSNWRGKTSLTS